MSENEKQCPFCGATINSDAKKCRFCGKWLDAESEAAQKNSLKKRGINYKGLIALAILLLLVIGFVLYNTLYDEKKAMLTSEECWVYKPWSDENCQTLVVFGWSGDYEEYRVCRSDDEIYLVDKITGKWEVESVDNTSTMTGRAMHVSGLSSHAVQMTYDTETFETYNEYDLDDDFLSECKEYNRQVREAQRNDKVHYFILYDSEFFKNGKVYDEDRNVVLTPFKGDFDEVKELLN